MVHYRAYVVLNYKQADRVAYDVQYGMLALSLILVLIVLLNTIVVAFTLCVEDALVAQPHIIYRKLKDIHFLILLRSKCQVLAVMIQVE